jgi:hypothetical protein
VSGREKHGKDIANTIHEKMMKMLEFRKKYDDLSVEIKDTTDESKKI